MGEIIADLFHKAKVGHGRLLSAKRPIGQCFSLIREGKRMIDQMVFEVMTLQDVVLSYLSI